MTEMPVPRKALVIGVSEYSHLPKLPVSDRDASRFKARLLEFGFDVHEAATTSRASVLKAIHDFAATLDGGELVVVYYSGHGFQRNEFNYLVPADAPSCPRNIVRENVPVTHIGEQLEKRGVAAYLMILDACRTTPHDCTAPSEPSALTRRLLPPTGGLALPRARDDVELIYASWMLALAASPGRPAWSGSDGASGSLYSRHLVGFFGTRGWDLNKMFKAVRNEVRTASSGQQIPVEHDVTVGEIFIEPDDAVSQGYRMQWEYTLSLNDAGAVARYLRSFPGSPYAAMARKWLKDHTDGAADDTDILLLSEAESAGGAGAVAIAMADRPAPAPALRHRGAGFPAERPAAEILPAGEAVPASGTGRRLIVLQAAKSGPGEAILRGGKANGSPKLQRIAGKTKTKVLTLDVPQHAPRTPGEAVELQVKAIDGVPVSEASTRDAVTYAAKPSTLPLQQIFPDKARGAAGANSALEQFGELKGAKVDVEISPLAPNAPTQGHARLDAFQRSLEIQKGLQDSGIDPKQIVVNMPETFMIEGDTAPNQLPQDQLKIIKPQQ